MLHRQPAIITIPGVRVNLEAQLPDVEIEGLILIVNVQTDYSDTLRHGASVGWGAVALSFPRRRRFSETAMMRSGLCAALTKQCGTCSRAWSAARSFARSWLGLSP